MPKLRSLILFSISIFASGLICGCDIPGLSKTTTLLCEGNGEYKDENKTKFDVNAQVIIKTWITASGKIRGNMKFVDANNGHYEYFDDFIFLDQQMIFAQKNNQINAEKSGYFYNVLGILDFKTAFYSNRLICRRAAGLVK